MPREPKPILRLPWLRAIYGDHPTAVTETEGDGDGDEAAGQAVEKWGATGKTPPKTSLRETGKNPPPREPEKSTLKREKVRFSPHLASVREPEKTVLQRENL